MPSFTLKSCRVLVAEDEYMLAQELETELHDAGAIVIGPVATLAEAITLINTDVDIDGAILDANLGGELVYPAAELLIDRGVPIVLTTGYDASAIPSRFRSLLRCEKPVDVKNVVNAIGLALEI